MHFKIEKDVFEKALLFVQTITNKKTTMPVLFHVLIEAVDNRITFKATDLEIGVVMHYPAEVIEEGSCLLHSKNIYEAVREFPNATIDVIKLENNWVKISSGKIFFNLIGLDSREYPKVPEFKKKISFSFPGHTLLEMINKTIFSIGKDTSRQNLSGCYIEKKEINGRKIIRFVSTDGHRLSLIDREIDDWDKIIFNKNIIVPRKGFVEIKKALEENVEPCDLSLDDNHLIFSGKNILILMRLIDGKFPDYTKVIPSNNDKMATFIREDFIKSLKRIAVASSDVGETIKCVKFQFSQNKLELSTASAVVGDAKEELEIEYNGPDLSIGFNSTYFLESLQSAESEKVNLFFEHELSPGIVKFFNVPDYLNVVMPIRI